MAKRYIGDAVITIEYHDSGDYRGTVRAGNHAWRFDGDASSGRSSPIVPVRK